MEDDETYCRQTLYQCNYRQLQKLAKSMSLPCNVKKMCLVELITAKKFSSDSEVNSIIQLIKIDRQQQAELRKGKKKANFKNNKVYYKKPPSPPISPPITTTPKRTGLTTCSNPEFYQSILKYKPKQAFVQGNQMKYTSPMMQNGSDRVLRSNNIKTINKNAGIFNPKKTAFGIIKAQNRSPPSPTKRQATISGIYPLFPKETPTILGYLQSIGRDGKISKIHALVQKRSSCNENYETLDVRKSEINLQDIINCKVDAQNIANSHMIEFMLVDADMSNNYFKFQRPIVPSLDKGIQCNLQESDRINIRANEIEDHHSVYDLKKTREEQVRCSSFLNTAREQYMGKDRLPKINEVFTNFRNIAHPLNVQTNYETKTINMHPARNNTNLGLLENLVNFRSQYLFNQPLLKIATMSNTKCVYSTSIVATPKAQPSSTVVFDEPFMSSGEEITGSISGATEFYEQDVSQDTCSSIPEMVEDAFEVISQDGDYMERIGMDEKVDCMLCSWAGLMIMLEHHIKKDHSDQIYKQDKNEWNITFTLGSLVQCQHQIVEYESTLYIVNARYEDPDCLIASISTLTFEPDFQTMGSITIYNKVNGKPYLWEGPIQPLQTFKSKQYQLQEDEHCLKLELSRLDLLPNSANLKLFNRELVNNSPNKVVVGQPELNDIHIILFIKIKSLD